MGFLAFFHLWRPHVKIFSAKKIKNPKETKSLDPSRYIHRRCSRHRRCRRRRAAAPAAVIPESRGGGSAPSFLLRAGWRIHPLPPPPLLRSWATDLPAPAAAAPEGRVDGLIALEGGDGRSASWPLAPSGEEKGGGKEKRLEEGRGRGGVS